MTRNEYIASAAIGFATSVIAAFVWTSLETAVATPDKAQISRPNFAPPRPPLLAPTNRIAPRSQEKTMVVAPSIGPMEAVPEGSRKSAHSLQNDIAGFLSLSITVAIFLALLSWIQDEATGGW